VRTFTTEEYNDMMLELTLGKPRKVFGDDADEFRAELQKELDAMEAEGLMADAVPE
jgi:hypothetical protein